MNAMERRVAALERRLERLESASGTDSSGAARADASDVNAARADASGVDRDSVGARASGGRSVVDESLRLLHRLRERGPAGAITYAGAAGLDGREYLWAKEHGVRDLVEADWATAAATLGCLGSPARLALLAATMGTPRTRAQLQEVLGETSTGHLYHHLRELQSAGLLVQRRRGEYELAAHALVPLLTMVAAALDLDLGDGGGGGDARGSGEVGGGSLAGEAER